MREGIRPSCGNSPTRAAWTSFIGKPKCDLAGQVEKPLARRGVVLQRRQRNVMAPFPECSGGVPAFGFPAYSRGTPSRRSW